MALRTSSRAPRGGRQGLVARPPSGLATWPAAATCRSCFRADGCMASMPKARRRSEPGGVMSRGPAPGHERWLSGARRILTYGSDRKPPDSEFPRTCWHLQGSAKTCIILHPTPSQLSLPSWKAGRVVVLGPKHVAKVAQEATTPRPRLDLSLRPMRRTCHHAVA